MRLSLSSLGRESDVAVLQRQKQPLPSLSRQHPFLFIPLLLVVARTSGKAAGAALVGALMTSDDATTLRARADQLQRRMSRGRCRLALRVAAQSLTPSPNAVPNLAEPSVIFVLINFF